MPKLLKAEQCGSPLLSSFPYTIVRQPPPRLSCDVPPSPPDNTVSSAQEQADQILANARRESRRIFEQSRAAGYKAGYDEGFEAGQAEGTEQGGNAAFASICRQEQERIRQATALAGEFSRAQEEFLEALREQSLVFAFEIVRKILRAEATQSPESMEPMLLDLLAEIREANPIVLIVSQEMRDRLLACETFMAALAAMPAQVEIRADTAMENGDCLIDTPDYAVDAGIFSQMERLKESFL